MFSALTYTRVSGALLWTLETPAFLYSMAAWPVQQVELPCTQTTPGLGAQQQSHTHCPPVASAGTGTHMPTASLSHLNAPVHE